MSETLLWLGGTSATEASHHHSDVSGLVSRFQVTLDQDRVGRVMILSDLESDWDCPVDHEETAIAFRLTCIRPVLYTNRIRCWVILEEPNRHVDSECVGSIRRQIL